MSLVCVHMVCSCVYRLCIELCMHVHTPHSHTHTTHTPHAHTTHHTHTSLTCTHHTHTTRTCTHHTHTTRTHLTHTHTTRTHHTHTPRTHTHHTHTPHSHTHHTHTPQSHLVCTPPGTCPSSATAVLSRYSRRSRTLRLTSWAVGQRRDCLSLVSRLHCTCVRYIVPLCGQLMVQVRLARSLAQACKFSPG